MNDEEKLELKFPLSSLVNMMGAISKKESVSENWKYELMLKQTAIDMAYATRVLADDSPKIFKKALDVESRIAGIDPKKHDYGQDPVPAKDRVNLAREILAHGPLAGINEQKKSKPKQDDRTNRNVSTKSNFDFSQDAHYRFASQTFEQLSDSDKRYLRQTQISRSKYIDQVLGVLYVQSQWHKDFVRLFDTQFGKTTSASQQDVDAFFALERPEIRSRLSIPEVEANSDSMSAVKFLKPPIEVPYNVIPPKDATPRSLIDAIVMYEGRGMYNDVFDLNLLGLKPFGIPRNRQKWREMVHAGIIALDGPQPDPTNTFYELGDGKMFITPVGGDPVYKWKEYPVSQNQVLWTIILQHGSMCVGIPPAIEAEAPGPSYVFTLSARSLEVWATRNELRRQDIVDSWTKRFREEAQNPKYHNPKRMEKLKEKYKEKCWSETGNIEILRPASDLHPSAGHFLYLPPLSSLQFPKANSSTLGLLQIPERKAGLAVVLYKPVLPLYSDFI